MIGTIKHVTDCCGFVYRGVTFKDYVLATVSNKYMTRVLGMIGLSLTTIVINETILLIKGYFWRNYVTELVVSNTDTCYQWLLQWISKHNEQLLHFTVTTTYQKSESGHTSSKFNYEPSTGDHVFK